MQTIMFCTQCGTKLDDTARFCISCGKSTREEPPAPAYSAPPHYAYTATASAPPRRLRKIVAEKKIAGVCAGYAEYFDIDVTLMRIIWVAMLLLPPHIGAIAYIVSMIVLKKG